MKLIQNKRIKFILIITIICIIIGLLIPSLMNKSLIKSRVENYILSLINNKIQKNSYLLRTSRNNLVENTTISFMPIIHLIPISILIYIIKTISIGSTITYILIKYKIKGLLYIPPIIIPNILSLIILSVSLYYAITYTLVRKRKINKKKLLKDYLIIYIITSILQLIISYIETYITINYFPLFK